MAGCTPGTRQQTGPATTIRQHVARSAVIAVVPDGPLSPVVAGVITDTARPREDLDILLATRPVRVLVTSTSPGPVPAVIPGRPLPPGPGATSFQQAQYARQLRHWEALASARRITAAAETRSAVTRWTRSLFRPQVAARGNPSASPSTSLAAECSIAASEVTELRQAGGSLDGRRVVLLEVSRLNRVRKPGELTGDKVIVLTPYLPSAAATAAAEQDLRATGATWSTVLGPGVPARQIRTLVAAWLTRTTVADAPLARALFANGSAVLRPSAARVLAPLVRRVRRPGRSAWLSVTPQAPATSGPTAACPRPEPTP